MELLVIAVLIVGGPLVYVNYRVRSRRRAKAKFDITWTLGDKVLNTDTVVGVDQLLDKDDFFAQAKELVTKGKVGTEIELTKLGRFGRIVTVKVTMPKGNVKVLTYKAIQV